MRARRAAAGRPAFAAREALDERLAWAIALDVTEGWFGAGTPTPRAGR